MQIENIYLAMIAFFIPAAGFLLGYWFKRFMESMERESQDRRAQNILIIRFLKVLGENDQELFEALESGKTNGNLGRAKDRLERIVAELDLHVLEKASKDD